MHSSSKNEEDNLVFNANNEGFLVLDTDLKVVHWNSNMENLTGFPAKDMMNKHIFDHKFPHLYKMKKVVEKSFHEKKTYTFDHQRQKDGRWLSLSLFPVEDFLIINITDIDESKTRDLEIASVKRISNDILNSTSDVIWAIDHEYKLLSANATFFKMMKKRSGEEIKMGESVIGNRSENDVRKNTLWKELYNRSFKGKKVVTTISINEKNKESTFEVAIHPIILRKGTQNAKQIGVACFARDITERLNQLRSIEEQNCRLREIAWMQSHKTRAPPFKYFRDSKSLDRKFEPF